MAAWAYGLFVCYSLWQLTLLNEALIQATFISVLQLETQGNHGIL